MATEQAAMWLVAMHDEGLSSNERIEFIDWLRESPVHVAEMLRVAGIDRSLKGFSNWPEFQTLEQLNDNIVRLPREDPEPPQRQTGFWQGLWVAAAGLAAVVLITGAWFLFNGEAGTHIRTQLAERREITLVDGSVITIAPLSEIRIKVTSEQRSIKLLTGQALFNVAKDPQRPFTVQIGSTIVRAVGTSFDIERTAAGVRVTVIDGRVTVMRRESGVEDGDLVSFSTSKQMSLQANEELIVPSKAPIPAVHQVNGSKQAAWATGTLIFEDETVAEVVRRFNLHNIAQLQILDSQLAGRRISGTFKAADLESFVAFIHTTNADLERDGDAILLKLPTQ